MSKMADFVSELASRIAKQNNLVEDEVMALILTDPANFVERFRTFLSNQELNLFCH